jgi:hypothetical protein
MLQDSAEDWKQTDGQSVYTPLLPWHRIRLFAPTDREQAKRFADQFRETWRLPLRARSSLLKHWREKAVFTAPFLQRPQLELLRGWSGREHHEALACVSPGGFLVRFWVKAVAVMPDTIVQNLIAHELALVLGIFRRAEPT